MNDSLKKIILSINKNFTGIESLLTDILVNEETLNELRNAIGKKISTSKNKDDVFYYKKILNQLNLENLIDCLKNIDSYIYMKQRQSKENVVKNLENKVNNYGKTNYKEKLNPMISKKDLSIWLQELLEGYIHIYSRKNNIVYLYLLNSTEEQKYKEDMVRIESSLKDVNIGFKLIVVDRNSPLDNMTPKEKEEFKDFLKNY